MPVYPTGCLHQLDCTVMCVCTTVTTCDTGAEPSCILLPCGRCIWARLKMLCRSLMVREGELLETDILSELGIFGAFLWGGRQSFDEQWGRSRHQNKGNNWCYPSQHPIVHYNVLHGSYKMYRSSGLDKFQRPAMCHELSEYESQATFSVVMGRDRQQRWMHDIICCASIWVHTTFGSSLQKENSSGSLS